MSKIFYFFGNKKFSLQKIRDMSSFKGIPSKNFVLMDQTHSNLLKEVDQSDLGSGITKPALAKVDALVTNKKGVLLLIKTADCLPILLYDRQKLVIAAIHSGREGTKKGIIKNVIEYMAKKYSSKKLDLKILVGAGISAVNYQVSEKIFDDFVRATSISQKFPFLDLQKVILQNLLDLGIQKKNIDIDYTCTYTHKKYFSFRENGTKQRQMSAIGIL